MEQLLGKVAVVPCAAEGIDKALARRFGAEGMAVAQADVDEERVEATAPELEKLGRDVPPFTLTLPTARLSTRSRTGFTSSLALPTSCDVDTLLARRFWIMADTDEPVRTQIADRSECVVSGDDPPPTLTW